jgi:hypothetical protein
MPFDISSAPLSPILFSLLVIQEKIEKYIKK